MSLPVLGDARIVTTARTTLQKIEVVVELTCHMHTPAYGSAGL